MAEAFPSIDDKIQILMDSYVSFRKQGNITYLFVSLSEDKEKGPHVLIGEIDTETEFAEDTIRDILIEEERHFLPIRTKNFSKIFEDRGYAPSYSFDIYDNDSMSSLLRGHYVSGSYYRYSPPDRNPVEEKDTLIVTYNFKGYEHTDNLIKLKLDMSGIRYGLSSWVIGRTYSKNDKDILKESLSIVEHHYNILHPFIRMYKESLAEHQND